MDSGDIIDRFGGDTALAKKLNHLGELLGSEHGVSPQAVRHWRERGIPHRWDRRLIMLSGGWDAPLSLDELARARGELDEAG